EVNRCNMRLLASRSLRRSQFGVRSRAVPSITRNITDSPMQLNPQHLKIASLFERRMFRIPEYQRAYSWTTRQRNDLFHDIEEAARTDREHFMATLVALARGVRRIGIEEFTTVELV